MGYKVKLQKRQLRRSKIFAIVLGSAAIIGMGLTIYSQMMKAKAFQVLYQIINRESISRNKVVFQSVILQKTTINIVKYSSKFHCTERCR